MSPLQEMRSVCSRPHPKGNKHTEYNLINKFQCGF